MTRATDVPAALTPWTVVIPVKAPSGAKSRLSRGLPPGARAALARAFALDTIAAALAATSVGRVIVVGDDRSLAGGAEFVPEPTEPPRSLTKAIAWGIASARSDTPGPVAALLGDLPALRPEELDRALAAAWRLPLAFVRDGDGTGTTLATATADVAFEPRFGPDSAARHLADGFVEIAASDDPGLHRDVDTVEALADALMLGVGPRTAEVAAGISLRRGTTAP